MAGRANGRSLDGEKKMYSEASEVGPFIVIMLTLHALAVGVLILLMRFQVG
ncbi:MAG TPA: hypothetical protein VFN74_15920 [Chloroflexota bacterium]|jgi:hypothetical protein|nr:hypothetical protein [Chloroflexota bacterium]